MIKIDECIKKFLRGYNTLFLIAGGTIFYKMHSPLKSLELLDRTSLTMLVMVLAGSIIALAGYSFQKTFTENRRCLLIYASGLLIHSIVFTIMTILFVVTVNEASANRTFEEHYRPMFNNFWANETIRDDVIRMQIRLKCCGPSSPVENWFYHDDYIMSIPGCCADKQREICSIDSDDIFQTDCCKAFLQYAINTRNIIGGVDFVLVAFELFGVICVIYLLRSLGNDKSKEQSTILVTVEESDRSPRDMVQPVIQRIG